MKNKVGSCKDKMRVSVILNIVLIVNMIFIIFIYMNTVNKGLDNKNKIVELESTIENLKLDYENKLIDKDKEIYSLKIGYGNLYNDSLEVNKINKELLEDNIMLENDIVDAIEENEKLIEKINVYEEYEVFMYRDSYSGRRTDCDYNTLMYLDSLIKDKAVDNLPFYCSWIMIESTWSNHDKNPNSTANGLPQFLEGTGKWIYEIELGHGRNSYIHDEMVTNPETSLEMMVCYVDLLMDQYNGNLHKVIDSYRGFHDVPYLNKFDKYLSYFNTSIAQVARESMQRYNSLKA